MRGRAGASPEWTVLTAPSVCVCVCVCMHLDGSNAENKKKTIKTDIFFLQNR